MPTKAHQELRALFEKVLALDAQGARIPEDIALDLLGTAVGLSVLQLRRQGCLDVPAEVRKRVDAALSSTGNALHSWGSLSEDS